MFSDLKIDLLILLFGTNDSITYPGYNAGDWLEDARDYVANLRAVRPACDVLIITPAINPSHRELDYTMYMMRDAQYLASHDLEAGYVDLIPAFGFDSDQYKSGSVRDYFEADDLHPNVNGSRMIKRAMGKALLKN